MGIGKNGSSKRSRNLAGFPRFSKKPARTSTHLGKWRLAKRYRTTHPIKAALKNLPQSTASMIRPTKRAVKFGSPYHSGKRQARYESLRLSPVYQPVWLFISWQLAFSPRLSWLLRPLLGRRTAYPCRLLHRLPWPFQE